MLTANWETIYSVLGSFTSRLHPIRGIHFIPRPSMVKMVAYRPRIYFLFFLWTETNSRSIKTQKKRTRPIAKSRHLDRTSLVNKRQLICFRKVWCVREQNLIQYSVVNFNFEPITCRKSKTQISRNIDGSLISKSCYYLKISLKIVLGLRYLFFWNTISSLSRWPVYTTRITQQHLFFFLGTSFEIFSFFMYSSLAMKFQTTLVYLRVYIFILVVSSSCGSQAGKGFFVLDLSDYDPHELLLVSHNLSFSATLPLICLRNK